MTVYLIHLDQPLDRGMGRNGTQLQAAHYIGETDDLETRLEEHRTSTWEAFDEPSAAEGPLRKGEKHGNGATFLAVANSRGIDWSLVRVWEGQGREFEQRLKSYKNAPLLCPVCTVNALEHMKGEC